MRERPNTEHSQDDKQTEDSTTLTLCCLLVHLRRQTCVIFAFNTIFVEEATIFQHVSGRAGIAVNSLEISVVCELLPSHKSKSLMRSHRVQVFILVHRVYKHRVVVSDNAQRGFVNPPMVRDHEEPFAMKGTESNRKRDWGHWEIAREEERGRKSLDGSIAQMLLPRSWQRATLDSLTIKWRACHRFLSSLPFNDMKLRRRDHGAEKSHQKFRTILRTTRI